MHSFAQTNIQLINQLRGDGYSTTEISTVVTSYELAMRLFTGLFRGSGKTFIAHLVGTASILGTLRVPSSLVAAGLSHAAYSAGDFGDGKKGMANAKREWIKSGIGNEVEEYVARYTALSWRDEAIPAILDGLGSLRPLDRDVLLIRLANELEEFLDFGILYCGDEKRRQVNYVSTGKHMIEMAEKLGYPKLAVELEKAFEEAVRAEIPGVLRRPDARNFSFLVAPQSYQRVYVAGHSIDPLERYLEALPPKGAAIEHPSPSPQWSDGLARSIDDLSPKKRELLAALLEKKRSHQNRARGSGEDGES